jgi:hypothetical protein
MNELSEAVWLRLSRRSAAEKELSTFHASWMLAGRSQAGTSFFETLPRSTAADVRLALSYRFQIRVTL